MILSFRTVLNGGALALAATALLALPSTASAQFGRGNGFGRPGIGVGGFPGGGIGGGAGLGGAGLGAAAFNQQQGVQANQTNTRSRFALNTSVTGSGVLNSSLDPVTQFGMLVNGQQMMGGNGVGGFGGLGGYGGFGGGRGGGLGVGLGMTQNGLGTLTKQPPGIVMNAMYNNSTTYGIFGNQQVSAYGGATPGFGGFGGYGGIGYGGYGGFPGKFGFGNGGYGY